MLAGTRLGATQLSKPTIWIFKQALAKLGFLNWIGGLVEETILSVPIDYRLSAALLLILWVSGICSAIIDNIPFTTMMIPVITNLGKNPDVQVTFRVLVFNVFSFKLLLKTLCRGRNYKRFHHVFPTQSNGWFIPIPVKKLSISILISFNIFFAKTVKISITISFVLSSLSISDESNNPVQSKVYHSEKWFSRFLFNR